MIRIHACEREQRFHRVKTVHLVLRRLDLPLAGELTDVVVRVFFTTDEITIKRENRVRHVVAEQRLHGLAERLGRSTLMNLRINRVVEIPFGLRQLLRDLLMQTTARRRVGSLAEQRQSRALVRSKFIRQTAQRIQRFTGSDSRPALRETRRAIRIIKIQNRSLRKAICAAVAAGEQRISLHFDRTTFVRLGDKRNGSAARRHGRSEILRRAVNEIFRRFAERQ